MDDSTIDDQIATLAFQKAQQDKRAELPFNETPPKNLIPMLHRALIVNEYPLWSFAYKRGFSTTNPPKQQQVQRTIPQALQGTSQTTFMKDRSKQPVLIRNNPLEYYKRIFGGLRATDSIVGNLTIQDNPFTTQELIRNFKTTFLHKLFTYNKESYLVPMEALRTVLWIRFKNIQSALVETKNTPLPPYPYYAFSYWLRNGMDPVVTTDQQQFLLRYGGSESHCCLHCLQNEPCHVCNDKKPLSFYTSNWREKPDRWRFLCSSKFRIPELHICDTCATPPSSADTKRELIDSQKQTYLTKLDIYLWDRLVYGPSKLQRTLPQRSVVTVVLDTYVIDRGERDNKQLIKEKYPNSSNIVLITEENILTNRSKLLYFKDSRLTFKKDGTPKLDNYNWVVFFQDKYKVIDITTSTLSGLSYNDFKTKLTVIVQTMYKDYDYDTLFGEGNKRIIRDSKHRLWRIMRNDMYNKNIVPRKISLRAVYTSLHQKFPPTQTEYPSHFAPEHAVTFFPIPAKPTATKKTKKTPVSGSRTIITPKRGVWATIPLILETIKTESFHTTFVFKIKSSKKEIGRTVGGSIQNTSSTTNKPLTTIIPTRRQLHQQQQQQQKQILTQWQAFQIKMNKLQTAVNKATSTNTNNILDLVNKQKQTHNSLNSLKDQLSLCATWLWISDPQFKIPANKQIGLLNAVARFVNASTQEEEAAHQLNKCWLLRQITTQPKYNPFHLRHYQAWKSGHFLSPEESESCVNKLTKEENTIRLQQIRVLFQNFKTLIDKQSTAKNRMLKNKQSIQFKINNSTDKINALQKQINNIKKENPTWNTNKTLKLKSKIEQKNMEINNFKEDVGTNVWKQTAETNKYQSEQEQMKAQEKTLRSKLILLQRDPAEQLVLEYLCLKHTLLS